MFARMTITDMCLWLLVCFITIAASLAPSADQILRSFHNISFAQNVSSSLDSPSSNTGWEIICDSQYGLHPNIVDCGEAKESLSPDMSQYTFAERHSGPEDANERPIFPLPFRTLGSRCSWKPFSRSSASFGGSELTRVTVIQLRECASFRLFLPKTK